MNLLARIFSIVLHPILMPLYALAVVIYTTPYGFMLTSKGRWFLFLTVFVFTFILPILFILLLRMLGWVSSLHMKNSRERVVPLLFAVLSCYINGLVFSNIAVLHPLFSRLLVLLAFLLLILAGITRFWKISIHMSALGAVLALVFSLSIGVLLPILILLAGILGSVRLYLHRHTPAQVYVGFALGFIFLRASVYYLIY